MKGKQWIPAAMAAAALVMPLSSYAAAAPQASPAAVTQKAQVPAPAYADSTLQATRYGLLQARRKAMISSGAVCLTARQSAGKLRKILLPGRACAMR